MIPLGILAGSRTVTAPSALSGTWTAGNFQNTFLSTYTFGSVNFGTASATRNIVAALIGQVSSGSAAPSSVTIGGVAATLISGSVATDAFWTVSFWRAVVPTGTSGSVVAVFPQSYLRMGMAAWIVNGTINTTSAQAVSTSGTPATTVTAAAGGFVCSYVVSTLNRTFTWTNATERQDVSPDGSRSMSVADSAVASGSTVTTATPSTTANFGMVTVAFGP